MTDHCSVCSPPPPLVSIAPHCSQNPGPTLLASLHTDSMVLRATLRCRLVLAFLFFREGTGHPLASYHHHPAAGLTTFPRKSRLWVVTSQNSTRKGRLKWACGADVAFRDWGWERRPEATPASVPRSLTSTAALCDT